MKNVSQILNDLITDFLAVQNKVTYFGKDSVIRAIFYAIANVIFELWNDVVQIKRNQYVLTAQGENLDLLASRYNLTRNGPQKSSVIVVFKGEEGTVIPKLTLLRSRYTGELYETTSDLILGRNSLSGYYFSSIELGDAVVAVSINAGSNSKVEPNELTDVVNPIPGLLSLTNYLPSSGGGDIETDSELRERISEFPKIFSQGTQAFYERITRAAAPDAKWVRVEYSPLSGGTEIYLGRQNLAAYSDTELANISQEIYSRQRALSPVRCKNVIFRGISVSCDYTRVNGFSREDVFISTAELLSSYISPKHLTFGGVVLYSEVVRLILSAPGVLTANMNSIKVNNFRTDVLLGSRELPRLIHLSMNDGTTVQKELSQVYLQ